MIRRAFLRRMAHAAMAGMLGAELMLRAPKVEDEEVTVVEQWWGDDSHFREATYGMTVGDDAPMGTIIAIDRENNTITMEWE